MWRRRRGVGGSRGSSSHLQVQAALRALNYGKDRPVVIDGYFGPETRDALHSFQKRRGLPESDGVGGSTWLTIQARMRDLGRCPG